MRQAAEDFIKCLFLDFPKPRKISSHSDNFYFHFFKGKFLIISKEFGGSEKGRSLISAYRILAITTNTPGFKKLSTALS